MKDSAVNQSGEVSGWLAAGVTLVLTVAMVWLQVMVYPHRLVPLTYALPLLVGLWHRSRVLLWGMAVCFMVVSAAKLIWLIPDNYFDSYSQQYFFTAAQWLNNIIPATVVHLMLNYRERLEQISADAVAANEELEASNEELAAREEEISRQNEELQQQTEELQQQTEELRTQAEEIQLLNEELASREKTLQLLLQLSGPSTSEIELLDQICRAGAKLLHEDVLALAILERCEGQMVVRAHSEFEAGFAEVRMPAESTLASLALERMQVAQLEDTRLRQDLVFPPMPSGEMPRSIVSVPLNLTSGSVGALEAYARQPREWSVQQVQLLRWLAGQCARVWDGVRLRDQLARQQEALRASEQRYRSFVEASSQVVWTTNSRGEVEMAIPAWQALTGQTTEEAQGLGWMEAIHADDRAGVAQAWRKASESRGLYQVAYRLKRYDGLWRDILARGVPVLAADGRVREYVGTCIDITEQKQAEEAVRQSEAKYRRLHQSMMDAFVTVDMAGNIREFNESYRKMLGYEPEELKALRYFDLTPEPWHSIEGEIVRTQILPNGYSETYEKEYRRKDGTVFPVELRTFLIRDDHGQPSAMWAIVRDITDRKQSEEALRKAKAAAEAANEAKGQFLANMSHELRTPMNAILGMLDLASPKAKDPMVLDCLQTARGSADLLLRLLNDLLDSAKIDSGKLELESAPFSLREMLDQITRVLAVRGSEKGLTFKCRVAEQTPDAVTGDRTRLEQILLNLAGNAIKFTNEGEVEICIRSEMHGSEASLEFSVRDTGIGIPPARLAQVFEPFTQSDASMTRRFGGTGLGLSICKSLVEMMGSTIRVESEPNRGSTFSFTIRLPLAAELPSGVERLVPVASTAIFPLKILLVEDNPANQKLARYILEDRGHVVEVAANGHEARLLSQRNCYDVILMDVQMPGMNGLDVAAAIRKREDGRSRVPILAMTAHAMQGDRERCLNAGMDGYLSKPINGQEMIGLVEQWSGQARAVARGQSPVPPGAAPAPLFARERAIALCAGSRELLADMVRCFREDVRSVLPLLEEAFRKGNLGEIARLAHRVKGTLVYLGAEPAVSAALALEEIGTRTVDAAEVERMVNALVQQCRLLSAALAGDGGAGFEAPGT